MLALSILDLAPIIEGGSAAETFANSAELARQAEACGYARYWLAEHHNMPGIASAATAVLIGHVAQATSRIRVGAGGIMLPNHAPLQVAEQFGTLAALHPRRIDLGLGRAPGTDQAAAQALRRYYQSAEEFPQDVIELLSLFEPAQPGQPVQAVPGAGEEVEVWILGSSLFGAQLAARLGLPYAFASHFAPQMLEQALAVYREGFRPSLRLSAPRVMLAMNAIAAESDAEARRLFTTQQQAFLRLRRGQAGRMPPPLASAEAMDALCTPQEQAGLAQALACSAIGTPEQVASDIRAFAGRHAADEIILTCNVFDHAARMRSLAMTAAACGLAASPASA
ncbi:LLM class flavin-dependent oxidoreductase [Luteimonas sp. e5]